MGLAGVVGRVWVGTRHGWHMVGGIEGGVVASGLLMYAT